MSGQRRTIDELVDTLNHTDPRGLARVLTFVESAPRPALRETVAKLHRHTSRARVVGITGPPGVGKSSLVSALATELSARARTVAVLAIDPSSPISQGAFLGDRVRMQVPRDAGIFIRSMASRGHLGGLAPATALALLVFQAAGFDDVIIETVGTGQSEIEVATTADTTVVALSPGLGDDVQAAKAGILEVADIFVVNKADTPGAGKLVSELRGIGAGSRRGEDAGFWEVPIVRTVAVRAEGVADVVDAIEAHSQHVVSGGQADRRHLARARYLVRQVALAMLREQTDWLERGTSPLLERLSEDVAERRLDPFAAADQVLGILAAPERGVEAPMLS